MSRWFAMAWVAIFVSWGGYPVSSGTCHAGETQDSATSRSLPTCPCHGQPEHCCVRKIDKEPVKRTVYDVKLVPVCEHAPVDLLSCDRCPHCQLTYKRVLIKREVVVGHVCRMRCKPVAVRPGH